MIELVIKLSEEDYDSIKEHGFNGYNDQRNRVVEAISNGIPLPKEHGRIMDADKVIQKMEEREEQLKDNRAMYETACVETALDMFGETIIEADAKGKGQER